MVGSISTNKKAREDSLCEAKRRNMEERYPKSQWPNRFRQHLRNSGEKSSRALLTQLDFLGFSAASIVDSGTPHARHTKEGGTELVPPSAMGAFVAAPSWQEWKLPTYAASGLLVLVDVANGVAALGHRAADCAADEVLGIVA